MGRGTKLCLVEGYSPLRVSSETGLAGNGGAFFLVHAEARRKGGGAEMGRRDAAAALRACEA